MNNKILWSSIVAAMVLSASVILSRSLTAQQKAGTPGNSQNILLQNFAKVDPIDSHTHVYQDNAAFNSF
ncbi:MAG: hypothetical protein ABI076_11675, partial [Acidobacteriaceae bacterium]